MTEKEALEIENRCDEVMSEAIGEKCTVSMALTGRLKVNFDQNYFSLNKDFEGASYMNFHGDYQDLLSYIAEACKCVSDNKELFDKLIWSYNHKWELM